MIAGVPCDEWEGVVWPCEVVAPDTGHRRKNSAECGTNWFVVKSFWRVNSGTCGAAGVGPRGATLVVPGETIELL